MTSYHPVDISERYCGRCHAFHEDPEAPPSLAAMLTLIATDFDRFSKKVAARVQGRHPLVRLAMNAVFAAFLRQIVVYLEGTWRDAPIEPEEKLQLEVLEDAVQGYVQVVPGLGEPVFLEVDREQPPS